MRCRPPGRALALSDNDTPRELSNAASYETSDSDHWPHKTDIPDKADAMDVDATARRAPPRRRAPEKPDMDVADDKAPLHRRFAQVAQVARGAPALGVLRHGLLRRRNGDEHGQVEGLLGLDVRERRPAPAQGARTRALCRERVGAAGAAGQPLRDHQQVQLRHEPLEAFQHQQSSSNGYSYKPDPADKNRASPNYVQRVEKKLMHDHQHFHHDHHHNEERARPEGSLFSLWNLSSDPEVRPDGQFSKHDDIYPRGIRGPRRDQYDQRQQEQPDAKQPQAPPQQQLQHFHIPQQPQLHGPFPHSDGPQHSHCEHGMPFPKMPGMPMGHPQRHEKHDFNLQRQGWIQPDYDSSNNYFSTNYTKEEPARRPLPRLSRWTGTTISLRTPTPCRTRSAAWRPGSSMETRLKMLEKEADERRVVRGAFTSGLGFIELWHDHTWPMITNDHCLYPRR